MNERGASHAEQLCAESIGTAGLVAIVVGSGIMAERLAAGNEALALLANSLATGAGLFALCVIFGPISGAHFNPAVTLSAWMSRAISARLAVRYVAVQFCGAIAGVVLAHAMFAEPLVQLATKSRAGVPLMASEVVATTGLLLVVRACQRHAPAHGPAAVALYITAAYWFTSSTSFANPAVTVARALTDTFTGIRPADLPGFWGGQLLAVVLVWGLDRLLWPARNRVA